MNAHTKRLIEIHTTVESLTSSPYSHDVIELALATATSHPLYAGEHPAPIWLLIAGAPSSGKTEGVLLLKGAPNITYLDAMTENSFVSGYVDKKTGKEPPQQFLKELDGKCLIVKDLTTIFSMREDRVRKILGDFQSIYDGEYAKATGTVGLKSYQSTFAMMGCITPLALHKHHTYMSMVGGRFLVIRLLPLTDMEREAGFERAWDEAARRDKLPYLRSLLIEHVESLLKEPVIMEPETAEQRQELNRLALLLARGRGVILTEKIHDMNEDTGEERYAYETADVQIEEPYRALGQLKTLGRALARIHGRARMTDHELELLRRVVLSTVSPTRGDALACFRRYPSGLTAKRLASEINKGESRARGILQEIKTLKLVMEDKGASGWIYRPIPDLADLITQEVRVLDHRVDLMEAATHAQNSPPTYSPILLETPPPGGTFV